MASTRCPAARKKSKGVSSSSSTVPTDAVLTIDELAVYLKLPKRTLYKLAQERTIPGHKVGRHWRFKRDTIDHWLDHGKGRGE